MELAKCTIATMLEEHRNATEVQHGIMHSIRHLVDVIPQIQSNVINCNLRLMLLLISHPAQSWVIKQTDITLNSVFRDQHEDHGTILHGSYNGKLVLVKRFKKDSTKVFSVTTDVKISLKPCEQDFMRDLDAWKALWYGWKVFGFHIELMAGRHPNVLQLIGHSSKSETYPFVVLSGGLKSTMSFLLFC